MNIQLSDHFSYKKLIQFVLPSIGMMIFTSVYGVVDGLFVSIQSFLITAEKPNMGFWITVIAGVTNMVLDALLIAVIPMVFQNFFRTFLCHWDLCFIICSF